MSTPFPIVEKYEDLAADMPLERIVVGLDDDGDGVADPKAWAQVQTAAQNRLTLAAGSTAKALLLPESAAVEAMRTYCKSSLYTRRGLSGDYDPFDKPARDADKRIRELAAELKEEEAAAGADFIGKAASIFSYEGNLP